MSWVMAAYGLLLIGGGFMGLKKAKSKQSAIAGGITGGIAILAAILFALHHQRTAYFTIGVLGWVVTFMFFGRYQKTKKLMPAVPMMVISMALGVWMAYLFFSAFGRS